MDEQERLELNGRFAVVVGVDKNEWLAVQELELPYLAYCRTENPYCSRSDPSASTTPLQDAWQRIQIKPIPR